MYAVIDVETTGLRPSWHDRVVEIAVVQVDASGRVEGEWCTLVNPERDLGPQHIHGITAAEARRAPRFDQVAGALAGLLRGRVVAAHNLSFDAQFVVAEFERVGVRVPVDLDGGLCTMRLAGQFLPATGRGLADCCRSAGVALTHAHSALHDARAAAGLLAHFLSMVDQPPPWMGRIARAATVAWPALPDARVSPMSRTSPGESEPHFLSRLVDRLPRTHRPDADAYLEVLDRALLDRHVSATEADALIAVATNLSLSRPDVVDLHAQYLQALAAIAAADGVVTGEEEKDLVAVAELLGLDRTDVDRVLRTATHAAGLLGVRTAREPVREATRFTLDRGDVVVFTGDMGEPREVWEERAIDAGLVVGAGVTKKTRLVVAADPDSMSGKAQKAGKYGIPVVHPAAFRKMLNP